MENSAASIMCRRQRGEQRYILGGDGESAEAVGVNLRSIPTIITLAVLLSGQAAQAQTLATQISMSFSGTAVGTFGSDSPALQGTGSINPFGQASLNGSITLFTFTFGTANTIQAQPLISGSGKTVEIALTITSGTGKFLGVAGTAQLTLYQVNVYVPSGVAAGTDVPVVVSVAGAASAPVTVAIQ
jgi:uncharacterized protein (TIGR03437 family)